jgi:adenylate cyclase
VKGPGNTRGTQIAVLEAERNERQTLAEGGLQGEKRVAYARLVMVVMFALATQIPHLLGHVEPNPVQTAVGATYMVIALLVVIVMRRITIPRPTAGLVIPAVTCVLDFAMITIQASLDVTEGFGFDSGMHAIACSILIMFAVARTSLWHTIEAVALAIISFGLISASAGVLWTRATMFVLAGFVVIGFLTGWTSRAVRRMFNDLRMRDNLTRFLPRQVAERVLRLGPAALAPVQREVTVLFSDIRGFTSMSERLEPRAVLALLDDYFSRMSQIVKGHDGVVGKFLGDGMMAFWGAPDRDPDHALRAVKAAADMRRGLVELNRLREQEGEPPIRIGIGIHTGTVAAGTLGGTLQSEYTVIGDAVNVASRIEGLTKTHEVDILISETTWSLLGGAIEGARLASETIRGRKEPVVLYTIGGP